MSSLSGLIASYMVNSLWMVVAIGGAGWVASVLLKRLGPGAQHAAWVATLALGIVTPALPLARSMFAAHSLSGSAPDTSSVLSSTARTGELVTSGSFALPQVLILVLSVLYLGIFLYFAIRFVLSLYSTATLLQGAAPAFLEEEGKELWLRCTQTFSVPDATILISGRAAGPVTIGLNHPVLLAPERFIKECTTHDLLAAMAHECAHMKRWDFQKNLLYEIASLAIAFHPVTWILKSQIAQTREMICDELATRAFLDSSTYAKALLRLGAMISLSEQAHVNAMGILDANILEKRIMMIRAKKQQLSALVKCGLIAAGAVILFAVAAGSGTLARSVEAQSTTGHAAPTASASTKKHVDLSCTFYDSHNPDKQKRMIAIPGTCVVYRHEPYCEAKIEKKLRREPQIGCEWKLRNAGKMR